MALKEQKRENNKFLFWLGVFAFVIFILYAPHETESVLGYKVAVVLHMAYVLVFLLLYRAILAKAGDKVNKVLRYLMVFLSMFAFSMFLNAENFGGTNMYHLILLCGCLSVILYGKREWLVLPLTAAAVGIGTEYVFLYGSIVPVLLFYQYAIRSDVKQSKQGRGYLRLCVLTIAVSVFMFFLRGGIFVFTEITIFCNFRRLGIFAICFLPYFAMAFFFFKGLVKEMPKKSCAWIISLGSLTCMPLLLLKNMGGSCVFSAFLYYAVMIGMLLAMRDSYATKQMERLKMVLGKYEPISIFIFVYPILFMPLNDASICRTVDYMVKFVLGG